MHILGIHFAIAATSPASSAVLHALSLDERGRVVALTRCPAGRGDSLSTLPRPDLAVLDTPVAVPNERGRRPAEELLAWCDIPVFPASRARLRSLYGGPPGEAIVKQLRQRGVAVAETVPRVVLRELEWEQRHDGAYLELGDYRAAWLSVRAPDLTGRGRRGPSQAGVERARELLEWSLSCPAALGDLDAPALLALSCAYAGLRAIQPERGPTLRLALDDRHDLLLPADVNLLRRGELHRARLSAPTTPRPSPRDHDRESRTRS